MCSPGMLFLFPSVSHCAPPPQRLPQKQGPISARPQALPRSSTIWAFFFLLANSFSSLLLHPWYSSSSCFGSSSSLNFGLWFAFPFFYLLIFSVWPGERGSSLFLKKYHTVQHMAWDKLFLEQSSLLVYLLWLIWHVLLSILIFRFLHRICWVFLINWPLSTAIPPCTEPILSDVHWPLPLPS